MSFAGPMVYSEFGKAAPSVFTMDSFIRGTTNNVNIVDVPTIQRADVNVEGTLWEATSAFSPPSPVRLTCPIFRRHPLYRRRQRATLPHRAHAQHALSVRCFAKQRAIIFGDFRMGTIRDVYDSSYDFSAVVNHISRTAKIPVLTGFPFGHITNKTTFPLGAHAKVRSTGNGGYSVTFSGYPTLNPSALTLDNLLPPPVPTYDSTIYRDSITEEVTE